MILQIAGIFVLAFVLGYILAEIPVRIMKKKEAAKRRKALAEKQHKGTERLN